MNFTTLMVGDAFSASSSLVDSAVKGTALLVLAAVAALSLRRDSAATRHFVWLLAIVAMLAIPVLSAMLPQWRVLPEWASVPPAKAVVAASPPSIARTAVADVEARNAAPVEVESPPSPLATVQQPAAPPPDPRPALATPQAVPAPPVWSWNWLNTLPLVWATGFCVMALRLTAARWILWNVERQGTVIWPSRQPPKVSHDTILTTLEAASRRLGMRRPVTLVHPRKAIPVVWGVLRCRLLLPMSARHWSGEQLRSVLLHELAHIKRRDATAQLLAQITCAMHWFNPMVWFAAWRLGVERERACDDLVLASGVRPSAYAGHLLDVVTGLSPSRWTQSCGLAVARKSSLEGRLVAVLSENLNRRGVSMALAAIALAIAVGIAVPIAMVRAADERPGATVRQDGSPTNKDGVKLDPGTEQKLQWGDPVNGLVAHMNIEHAPAGTWTGKLVTGETSGAAAAGKPEPKNKEARMLLDLWLYDARGNGNIPGGLVGRLGEKVKEFIRNNPGYAKKMAPLVPRLDALRDWTATEAVAVLDDIAAVHTIPLETTTEEIENRTIRTGAPLPPELANAPWGDAQPSGLRMAWRLEPHAAEYRLGTPLRSRILLHNSGKEAVVFRAPTWCQAADPKARDAKGANIRIDSTHWLTRWRLVPYRLVPGEFFEVTAAGIGVGANKNDEDWQNTNVGSWIDAKVGDDVTFTPGPVRLSEGNEPPPRDGVPAWWLDFITARLSLEAPLPTDAADRARLLDHVVGGLFGTAPTAEETAAFLADRGPNALDSLAKRLAKRPGVTPFTGSLTSGPTKFHVLPADPDAAKKPRTAKNPGRYTLGENIRLVVTRRPDGPRIVNEARIQFFSPDPAKPAPGEYEIKLPDGYNTWAAAWVRGSSVLWVMQKGKARSYDFTNPAEVKETTIEMPADLEKVPRPILDTLRGQLDAGAPKPPPATETPK